MFRLSRAQECKSSAIQTSKLYDQDDFYPAFIKDLTTARKLVVIESPFITARRMEMLEEVIACKQSLGRAAHVLTSSIRSVHAFAQAIILGADAATLPPTILREALEHPMTAEGVETFWKALA